MTGKSKPVKGHARKVEQSAVVDVRGHVRWPVYYVECECGEWKTERRKPAARAWHREHKAAVLAARDDEEKQE